MIIGVTGPICSGKGKVAEFFRDRGFTHHSFSAEIREIAKERGIEINRESLSKLGNDLRKESPKHSILWQRIIDSIAKDIEKGKKDFVVEGIRDCDEINLFREHALQNKKTRFVLIAVDALQRTRFERMKSRNRHGDPQTFNEFKRIDDKEIKGGRGQEVAKCIKMADYIIINEGDLADLARKVSEISEELAVK